MCSLLSDVCACIEVHNLTDAAVSALTGLSVPTIRRLTVDGVLPSQVRKVEALRSFVAMARTAKNRDDLRLAPPVAPRHSVRGAA